MANASNLVGVVHLFGHEDEGAVRDRIERYGRVTQAVPRRLDYPSRGIAVVGFTAEGNDTGVVTLEFICEYERQARVTNLENRLVLWGWYEFAPIPLNQVIDHLPSRLRQHFRLGFMPKATWGKFLIGLGHLRPEAGYILENLTPLRPRRPSTSEEEIVAFEIDAVNLALEISGMGRGLVGTPRVRPSDESIPVALFLKRLRTANLREDQIIQHDAEVFGGWQ